VVGWVDLAAADCGGGDRLVAALPGGGFSCGIRHPVLAEPDPGWLARPAVLADLRAVAAAGLVFDLVVRPDQLPAAVTAARAVPGLRLALDHLANPPASTGENAAGPWAAAIDALAGLPNVCCKLSGAHTIPAHTIPARVSGLRRYQTVLEEFGADRLMFGADWPVSPLAASYGQVCDLYRELTAGLSPAERHAIFDPAARRVCQLPP
jgi:L-fuconolactonase